MRAYVFTVVLLVLALILAHSALRKGGLWSPERFNDFRAYHTAAAAALERDLVSAYHDPERPYQYPPTLAVLILPLGLLPYRAALAVWVAGNLALLLWSFRVLDRVLCPPVKGIDKFFGFVLAYRMFESDFANSNANTLVLSLIVAAFLLERRSRSGWAGLVAALAASIKVVPLLLLPWILYRRRWRMAGGFAGGLVVWTILVPGTVLGPADLGRSLATWHRGLVAPLDPAAAEYALEAPGGYLPGQSLRALMHRLTRPIDATAHDDALVAVNLFDLPKGAVDAAWIAVCVLLLGGALAFFLARSRSPTWGGAEVAVAVLLTVLLSPLARKAHFVALLPAAAYGFMLARTATGARRWVSWTLWGLAAAAIVLTSPELLGERLSALALAFCPLSIAGLLLLAIPLIQKVPISKPAAVSRSP